MNLTNMDNSVYLFAGVCKIVNSIPVCCLVAGSINEKKSQKQFNLFAVGDNIEKKN